MNMKAIPILLSSVVLLAGCMGTPQREAAPVTEKSGSGTATTPGVGQMPDTAGEEEVQVRVYEPPALESKTPVHGKAVVALLTSVTLASSVSEMTTPVAGALPLFTTVMV